jgi:thiol:disulfide interchange protein
VSGCGSFTITPNKITGPPKLRYRAHATATATMSAHVTDQQFVTKHALGTAHGKPQTAQATASGCAERTAHATKKARAGARANTKAKAQREAHKIAKQQAKEAARRAATSLARARARDAANEAADKQALALAHSRLDAGKVGLAAGGAGTDRDRSSATYKACPVNKTTHSDTDYPY